MTGRVTVDVRDRLVDVPDDLHGEDVIEELGVKVLLTRRGAVDDRGGLFVKAQFDGILCADFHQTRFQHRQEDGRDLARDQKDFLGIADRGTRALRVLNDIQRHRKVGGAVDIDVTDTGTRLDTRNGGVFHTGADQTRSSARDQQIDIARGSHQLVRARAGGVLDKQNHIFIQSGSDQTLSQRTDDSVSASVRLFTAAQDADVPALQSEGGGVRGDVRAALIDDGDHTEGDGGLLDHETVGPLITHEDLADRRLKLHHVADALRHACDTLL